MECFSKDLIEAVMQILAGPVHVLAAIAAKGGSFIAEVKTRLDMELSTISHNNRDRLPEELVCRLVVP
jgi:nucleoside-triphosphatase THEP1